MTSETSDGNSTSIPAADDFFGHPRGLSFLFATELWERFAYYGMLSILVLYMVDYLFDSSHVDLVLGYRAATAALEFFFGPLEAQPKASHIYGLFTGLVYLTPILGGLLADRMLGQRRTVIVGAILMALGYLLMVIDSLFLLALLVLVFGVGAFKPNTATQVGRLYAPNDRRRDRAYSIFYVAINLGAFFAPLVCGTLGEKIGWQYGFATAGVGIMIGLGIYLAGTRTLPPDERKTKEKEDKSTRLDRAQ
jgi:proton-dependent oligopeptide transporter, POT family